MLAMAGSFCSCAGCPAPRGGNVAGGTQGGVGSRETGLDSLFASKPVGPGFEPCLGQSAKLAGAPKPLCLSVRGFRTTGMRRNATTAAFQVGFRVTACFAMLWPLKGRKGPKPVLGTLKSPQMVNAAHNDEARTLLACQQTLSIYLFHFRVWPQRQGPFADPSDLQRELAILTGFGPCHRASSEDFASYLVSLTHTHPTQIRTCDHCLGSRCPNHRLAVRTQVRFLFAYEGGRYHPVGSRHPARLIGCTADKGTGRGHGGSDGDQSVKSSMVSLES